MSVWKREAVVELLLIGTAFYCYAVSAALLFQFVLLPSIPSMHGGAGLLAGDSLFFHQKAIELAQDIEARGWSVWSPWPYPQVGCYGNVALLAVLYVFSGPDPVSIIPINAMLHAGSGLLIVMLGREFHPGRVGRWAGVVVGALFVALPSSLNWYAQVHKDTYSIFGFLLLLYSGGLSLKACEENRGRQLLAVIFLAAAGLAMTSFARPHNLQLFVGLAVLLCFVAGVQHYFLRRSVAAPLLVASLIVVSASVVKPEAAHQFSLSSSAIVTDTEALDNDFLSAANKWRWVPTDYIPDLVERIPKQLSNYRMFMAAYGVREGAKSMIDLERMPANLGEFFSYLPRAAQVAVFAPFPETWFKHVSPIRLIGVVEISLMYLLFPGVLAFLWWNRRLPAAWWVFGAAMLMLVAEGYLIANLGTLHRIRYPFLMVLMLMGAIGWARLLFRYWPAPQFLGAGSAKGASSAIETLGSPVQGLAPSNQLKRGAAFVVLNACLFLCLFLRDILLVREFGLGVELDAYQLASFVPLFATALFAVPLGPVIISQFILVRGQGDDQVALKWLAAMSYVALVVFFVLGLVSILIGVFGVAGVDAQTSGRARELALLMVPVVTLSACVVIGNSILSALGRIQFVVVAQLSVPLLGIAMILLFGHSMGALAAMLGLVLGQVLNLWLVARRTRSEGFSYLPRRGDVRWRHWMPQYFPLVGAAALTSASIPVGIYLASGLPSGAVSAFSLGAKVLMSITTLVSAFLVAIVLPHFSRLLAANQLAQARSSLNLIVSLGAISAVPCAIALFVLSDPIATLLFQGGKIGKEEVHQLASVMRLGTLQLPFFVVLAVLVKFMVANRTATVILVSAVTGQLANIAVASKLILSFSTAGVALAMSFGVAVSAMVALIWAVVRKYVDLSAFILIGISWMLFGALSVCVAYGVYLGAAVSGGAFLALAASSVAASNRRPTSASPAS